MVKLWVANWICYRRHEKHSICGSLSIWSSYKIYYLNNIENQSRALWKLHWTLHTSTRPGLDQASIYVLNHSVCLRIHTHTRIFFSSSELVCNLLHIYLNKEKHILKGQTDKKETHTHTHELRLH